MNEKSLLIKYSELESKIIPIKNFLHNNLDIKKYKVLYKGFLPLQGPLIYNPEILFLGYNPGPGAFYETKNNNIKEPPVRMLEKVNNTFVQVNLDWYKDGVAYGHFTYSNGKKVWKPYKWYQIGNQINNHFPARMLNILNEVAKLKYPDEKNRPKEIPFWYKTLGKRIIYYNLYPIATENIGELNKIHTAFSKEKSLIEYWQQSKGNEKTINNWVVRKYFLGIIKELVELTNPKIIVCLGVNTFNDFCSTKRSKKSTLFKEKQIYGKVYPVLGIDRSGNWSGRIPSLALQIIEKQK